MPKWWLCVAKGKPAGTASTTFAHVSLLRGAEVTCSGWQGALAITVTAAGDTPALPPCITLSGRVGHPRLAPGSRTTELRQIRVAVHPMETWDFHGAFGTARSRLRLQRWRWGS